MERKQSELKIERRLGDWLRSHLHHSVAEFIMFGAKMAWSSIFAGGLLFMIILTALIYPENASLTRYDFLVIYALLLQILMLVFRLESLKEAGVILLFHLSGTVMEVFKLAQGSWDYPEAGWLEIGGVPLFSGFMYASVGSFMVRAMRVFDMRFVPYPAPWLANSLALAIYVNFFTHHYIVDMRWLLIAATFLIFGRTIVCFVPFGARWHMPMVVAGVLSSLFLYLAENIGTLSGTWVYGSAALHQFTSPMKITSWYLLLYVSFTQVMLVVRKTGVTTQPARNNAITRSIAER